MITVVGTSKVPVKFKALEEFLTGILPEDKKDLELEIKMDARGNVKSTFMKVEGTKCSIYTGAIETEWDAKFISSDNVTSALDALIFIVSLAVKKAMAGSKFDMKLSSMANCRVDEHFTAVKGIIDKLVARYEGIAANTVEEVSTSSSSGSTSSSSSRADKNPYANQPLENVPVVDIPADLDLVGDTSLPVGEAPGLHID